MQTPAVVPIPHVGGPIVGPGCAQVLVAGLPAAVMGDSCICVGPIAPIVQGSFTVLLGGKPAARMGDMTAHGGAIMGGCPTVLIGDSGGGAGSPQGLTMSAAKAAGAPFTAMNCDVPGATEAPPADRANAPADPTKTSWIEIQLKDDDGKPVPHERYRVTPPGRDKPIEGFLDAQGLARIDGIDPGTCVITFPDLDAGSWEPVGGDPGRRSAPPPPEPEYEPGIAAGVRIEGRAAPPAPGITGVSVAPIEAPGITAVRIAPIEFAGITNVVINPIEHPGIAGIVINPIAEPGIVGVQVTPIDAPGIGPSSFAVHPKSP